MNIKSILDKNKSKIALIVGNGINQYGDVATMTSWQALLEKLATERLKLDGKKIPKTIALTEFYDLIELRSGFGNTGCSLQKEFCNLLKGWKFQSQHVRIVSWAKQNECPILTTNFESTLSRSANCKKFRIQRGKFTDYYPWSTYYGNQKLLQPKSGFEIWHINGMERYHRSIRLGLSHYMGSVQKARNWIHRGKSERLFAGHFGSSWGGADTWLDIIFHMPILIFGLGLKQDEVFLRWLLIERARYLQKFPNRKMNAWYVYSGVVDPATLFFLNGVGIKTIEASDYDEIYGEDTWT